jgi:hypothetical protein
LLEVRRRLPIGRTDHCLGTGLAAEGHRLVPGFAPQPMVGQPFDVLGQAVRIQPFERIHNPAVEGAPSLLPETPLRHLVGQCVLEGVFRLGEEAGLVEEPGSLQAHEPTAEPLVRHLGDGLKQGEGHLRADDRSGL